MVDLSRGFGVLVTDGGERFSFGAEAGGGERYGERRVEAGKGRA